MPFLTEPGLPSGRFGGDPQPRLSAGGLLLRPWEPGDLAVVLDAYADPDIQRWHVQSMTEPEAEAWIASWAERWQQELGAGWAVTDGRRVLGRVGLKRVVHDEALAEVAYWTLPHARGQRVASRALAAMGDWAFGVGFHRLELTHAVENHASCRVAERTGYVLEGTKRQEARHADGWHDMHLHARLAPGTADRAPGQVRGRAIGGPERPGTEPRAIRALGEVALRVRDLDAMRDFYERVVGLALMREFPGVAFFRLGEGYAGHTTILALFDRADVPEIEHTTLDHFAFTIDVAEYDAERLRLQAAGLEVRAVVFDWVGWRSLFFRDPEGNRVELVCRDPALDPE